MVRIGKIVATHSLQGSLVLTHIVGNGKWLNKEDVLFIALQKDSYIPYFVSQAKAAGNDEYTITLEDVDTVEQAKKLIGKEAYVQEDVLAKYATDSPLLWIGFTVVDKVKGNLGTVADIMQTASQWLATIIINDTEVLLPLIPQTIEQVNIKTKTLKMNLPEGLLEVYLGTEPLNK